MDTQQALRGERTLLGQHRHAQSAYYTPIHSFHSTGDCGVTVLAPTRSQRFWPGGQRRLQGHLRCASPTHPKSDTDSCAPLVPAL